jgi:hypothetical protein
MKNSYHPKFDIVLLFHAKFFHSYIDNMHLLDQFQQNQQSQHRLDLPVKQNEKKIFYSKTKFSILTS